jgi:hypothetical protein
MHPQTVAAVARRQPQPPRPLNTCVLSTRDFHSLPNETTPTFHSPRVHTCTVAYAPSKPMSPTSNLRIAANEVQLQPRPTIVNGATSRGGTHGTPLQGRHNWSYRVARVALAALTCLLFLWATTHTPAHPRPTRTGPGSIQIGPPSLVQVLSQLRQEHK